VNNDAFHQLAKVLNTLPNGYPSTGTGVEIKILKKIFDPDEAELFCDLRLSFETAKQISERTGRQFEGLEEKLKRMGEKGQIRSTRLGDKVMFKMMPYAVGIYEAQLHHMDQEFVELNDEYLPVFLKPLLGNDPPILRTVPIEEELPVSQEALPYQKISQLLDTCQSFRVSDCICKKEHVMLGKPCDRPLEVCLGMAKAPNYFDNDTRGRAISREEARAVLKKAEDEALVHMTGNFQEGHYFICNCCGCCCGVLRGVNRLGLPAWTVVSSDHYAVIDGDLCTVCGICADERCQVDAIEEGEDTYQIIPEKCIGCGLCISTCPVEAISLVQKSDEDIAPPPKNEMDWFRERARYRGVDISEFE
jgi:Na+-translocating ferredoxin:NAD+ oxidoreductase RNF subunit RnfB